MDPRHGTVVVVARNGAKYTGLIRNEDNFSLQMQTADGNFHLFDKSNVKSIEHSPRSIMPGDYESQLGDKGLNDLISYLIKAASTQTVNAENDEDK
jgi:putative heme-binding domain-containing protein